MMLSAKNQLLTLFVRGGLILFGKLVGNAFTQNRTSFSVDNLPVLFDPVDAVFKAAGQTSIVEI